MGGWLSAHCAVFVRAAVACPPPSPMVDSIGEV